MGALCFQEDGGSYPYLLLHSSQQVALHPRKAPHFGQVGWSFKTHFCKLMETSSSVSIFTLLAQVESWRNNHPLRTLSHDDDDGIEMLALPLDMQEKCWVPLQTGYVTLCILAPFFGVYLMSSTIAYTAWRMLWGSTMQLPGCLRDCKWMYERCTSDWVWSYAVAVISGFRDAFNIPLYMCISVQ